MRVAGNVVEVAVQVGDGQRDRAAIMGLQPVSHGVVDGGLDVVALHAGVEQDGGAPAEQQVEEWLFRMRAGGLSKDVEVAVVLVELEVRAADAGPAGRPPASGQRPARTDWLARSPLLTVSMEPSRPYGDLLISNPG